MSRERKQGLAALGVLGALVLVLVLAAVVQARDFRAPDRTKLESVTSALIADGTVAEADLKAVDSASDEDFLTYESTTGDFEWHSASDKAGTIAAAITEGQLADSIVVSADIKDATIVGGDLAADIAIATTGASVFSNDVYVGSAAVWRTLTVDGSLVTKSASAATSTDGYAVVRGGAFTLVSAAADCTNTVEDPLVIGAVKTIVNTGAGAITFSDGGNIRASADAVIDQYDALQLIAVATNIWVSLGVTDND